MYRPISFLVALALSCLPAEAGPWPREKGTLFGTLSQDAAHYTSLYFDLGITARTSLTLEAGKDDAQGEALLFFRHALTLKGKTTAALEIGAGPKGAQPVLSAGFSIGRGVAFGKRSGWVSADARGFFDISGRIERATLGLTLGQHHGSRVMSITQINSEASITGINAVLATSLVWEFKPGFHTELGAEIGTSAAPKAKLGIWFSF